MTAAPDIRLLMDNQFRNVKTHARFLSKATWYEWRMKLLEGLKEGLDQHYGQMKEDEQLVSKYEALLDEAVPALENKHTSLQGEATSLQQMADEMENCDQDELRDSREKLAQIDEEIAAKKQELQAMQEEVQDRTDTIDTGAELKAEFVAQIQEAERVKEECRGWSAKEINALKGEFLFLPIMSRLLTRHRLCTYHRVRNGLVDRLGRFDPRFLQRSPSHHVLP